MLTFLLLSIITVVCFSVAFIIDESGRSYDLQWLTGINLGVAICTLLAVIITGCSLININTRFEATQNEYEVISEMVQSYDGQDYGNMTALTESVVSINSTIARHKAHYKSKWTGPWFSEDIAKLEPITFRKNSLE